MDEKEDFCSTQAEPLLYRPELRGDDDGSDGSALEGARRLETASPASAIAIQRRRLRGTLFWAGQSVLWIVIVLQSIFLYRSYGPSNTCQSTLTNSTESLSRSPSGLPDYYQTSPELWSGPTPTGPAPFLAATNPAPFPSTTYIPNSPLETQVPISNRVGNRNIFELHGELSHYFPNPDGFGVNEYPLPKGARIVQLHMLSRHGARYPTVGAGAQVLAEKITEYQEGFPIRSYFTDELSFLNDWKYQLGNEILVPIGKQELFDSGTLHQYMYGHLYNGSKIIARTTTQDRMVKSAEYFLAGFFGLDWTLNATLVLAIEDGRSGRTWNNTLAGYFNCPNSYSPLNLGGINAQRQWTEVYLANATKRLSAMVGDSFGWTVADTHSAQSLCAYETVALGYSPFCRLFTYAEWENYEYSIDLFFAGGSAFQSPTGRAVGIGYVSELLARLQHHLITTPTAQINTTLDSNEDTFPLHQPLYFDFSHDTNIMSILTAFGFKQFAPVLPASHFQQERQLKVSHLEPFAARLDIEIIEAPFPVDPDRSNNNNNDPDHHSGGEHRTTKYIHFLLNQRTLPLGTSFPICGDRDDGWCELETFLQEMSTKLDEAQYEYACFGRYAAVPYGEITDGVPLSPAKQDGRGEVLEG